MLNWRWSEKVGYIVLDDENKKYKVNLYRGNALMIAIWEWNDNGVDKYTLYNFFADEGHAKRCLGLEKGHDFIMEGIKEVHLSADMDKDTEKLVKLWATAINKYQLDIKLVLEYME